MTSDTNSPNLKNVLNSKDDLKPSEKRMVPRLIFSKDLFKFSENGRVFSLTDLSYSGFSIRVPEENELASFSVGREISGFLSLGGEKLLVSARVRHQGPERAGLRFEENSPEVEKFLKEFLSPERLGSELRAMPHKDSGLKWYHGPSGSDLLLWQSNGIEIERWVVLAFGLYVEFSFENGLQTGHTHSPSERIQTRGMIQMESLDFQSDDKPQRSTLDIAKRMILSSNLEENHKRSILSTFGNSLEN